MNNKCPECGKDQLNKFGKKFVKEGGKRILKQQYQCKSCGRITIKPTTDNLGGGKG